MSRAAKTTRQDKLPRHNDRVKIKAAGKNKPKMQARVIFNQYDLGPARYSAVTPHIQARPRIKRRRTTRSILKLVNRVLIGHFDYSELISFHFVLLLNQYQILQAPCLAD